MFRTKLLLIGWTGRCRTIAQCYLNLSSQLTGMAWPTEVCKADHWWQDSLAYYSGTVKIRGNIGTRKLVSKTFAFKFCCLFLYFCIGVRFSSDPLWPVGTLNEELLFSISFQDLNARIYEICISREKYWINTPLNMTYFS